MSNKRKRQVVKYRKKRHISVGSFIFIAFLIYLTAYMIVYITRDKVTMYEVVVGKNATITNESFHAVILRDEKVYKASNTGYLNFFVKEGNRVSKTSTVYTVDESGTISSILSEASESGEVVYSSDDEIELRNLISQYTMSQTEMTFGQIYDFKQNIDAKILESINLNNIKKMLKANAETSGMNFKVNKAKSTGIVAYYIDGMENLEEKDISADTFNLENYSKKTYSSGDLVEKGNELYKVVNSEYWSMYFPLSEENVEKYRKTDYMTIKILKDNRKITGEFSIVKNAGNAYGKITLNKYMSNYIKERFLEIQLVTDETEGLKLPRTSVIEKDFFVIPAEYKVTKKENDEVGFYKKVYDEQKGEESIEFIAPTIYKTDDEYVYVDSVNFKEGDFVVKESSQDTYKIGNTMKLQGVYNINNGYCVFRRVELIAETGDYFLAKQDTQYGLKVYDHIVIDATLVDENQVVFSTN